MRVAYILAPYTKKSVESKTSTFGEITDESYRNFLDAIDTTAKSCGLSTILPHKDVFEWGKTTLTPEMLVKKFWMV